jgi:type VI secretion system protein ImpI
VQGLQQVLRTRAEIKNKLRLGNTMLQESGNNPLKLSGNYLQTLNNLLLAQSGYLSGPQAIRQALKDLQAHQVASFAASRTLLDSAFEQFSPTQLVYRFETSGQPRVWGNKQAYYWQQYQLHHQKMAADQEWRHSQFTHDYALVYEEQAQYINAAWSEFDAR